MRRLLPLLALAAATAPAQAALSPADLAGVGATPAADARLPHLPFTDQQGRPTRLVPVPLPTVLLFADYSCRHICGPGLTLTAGALHDARLRPGRDYRMVAIGLDQDGPAVARALAAARLRALPEERDALVLLTGTPAVVRAAEQALGYHAAYDAAADQFAHDAAIYVFAADGRLSALLPETATTPVQLGAAIARARAGAAFTPPPPKPEGGFGGRISAICYGLAASHGVYAGPVVLGLRLGGMALCLAALGLWGRAALRRRRPAA